MCCSFNCIVAEQTAWQTSFSTTCILRQRKIMHIKLHTLSAACTGHQGSWLVLGHELHVPLSLRGPLMTLGAHMSLCCGGLSLQRGVLQWGGCCTHLEALFLLQRSATVRQT